MVTSIIEEELKSNFKQFFESANQSFESERYNPAVSDYFKAIVILCDLKIYQKRSLLPKNHNERFLFLKIYYKDIEEKLNKLFEKYRDAYNLIMNREDALFLKKNVEEIRNLFGFKEDI